MDPQNFIPPQVPPFPPDAPRPGGGRAGPSSAEDQDGVIHFAPSERELLNKEMGIGGDYGTVRRDLMPRRKWRWKDYLTVMNVVMALVIACVLFACNKMPSRYMVFTLSTTLTDFLSVLFQSLSCQMHALVLMIGIFQESCSILSPRRHLSTFQPRNQSRIVQSSCRTRLPHPREHPRPSRHPALQRVLQPRYFPQFISPSQTAFRLYLSYSCS